MYFTWVFSFHGTFYFYFATFQWEILYVFLHYIHIYIHFIHTYCTYIYTYIHTNTKYTYTHSYIYIHIHKNMLQSSCLTSEKGLWMVKRRMSKVKYICIEKKNQMTKVGFELSTFRLWSSFSSGWALRTLERFLNISVKVQLPRLSLVITYALGRV